MLAYLPYAYDIVRGTARPNRATWLIWTVVGGLLFASYSAAAGGAARWVPLSDTLGPGLIAMLAFRYGKGGLSWFDLACLAIGGLSVLGWVLTGSAMVSLNINLFLALLGALPTFRGVYRDPAAEPAIVWCAFLLGNMLNLAAVEHWSWRSGAYPAYTVFAAGLISVLIFRPAVRRIILILSGGVLAGSCQDRLEPRVSMERLSG
jgi:hypothetical protein